MSNCWNLIKLVQFSINMCSEKGLICSTSDDRSARVWKVSFSSGRSWESAEVYQLHVLYGHTARVFRFSIFYNFWRKKF